MIYYFYTFSHYFYIIIHLFWIRDSPNLVHMPRCVRKGEEWHPAHATFRPSAAHRQPGQLRGMGLHVVCFDGYKIHWIGLRENLQETMVFTVKYWVFL